MINRPCIDPPQIPGRSDTLTDAQSNKTRASQFPRLAVRRALRGLKEVAQNTTTCVQDP